MKVSVYFENFDLFAEIPVEYGFTIRDKGKIVHTITFFPSLYEAFIYLLIDLIRRIEFTRDNLGGSGWSNLAIDTGIGTGLGWDIVDTQTAPQAA